MSILKRVGNKVIVKGTPPVAAIPPWTEYRPDPPATQATQNSLLAFGVIGGIPVAAVQKPSMPSSGGGSMSGSSSYSYSATSLNGVPANYIVTAGTDTVVFGPADLKLDPGYSYIVYAVGSLGDGSFTVLVQQIRLESPDN